jgi:hypothetical protein
VNNDIQKDDDFDGYLQSLLEKDKQKQDQAIECYKEWAEHFEMLKGNFEQVAALFYKISQTLPNWECSGPDSHEQISRYAKRASGKDGDRLRADEPLSPLGWDDEGYYFRISLTHLYDDEEAADSGQLMDKIEISFVNPDDDFEGIGNPCSITKQVAEYCLPPLEDVIGNKKIALSRAKNLLEALDESKLVVKVWYDSYDEDSEEDCINEIGIGYLYEHRLTDICKDIFKDIYKDDVNGYNIVKMFPDEDFSRRDSDDNKIHPKLDGAEWRNG